MVPRGKFMLVANYASLVTIVAIYLAYRVFGGVLSGDESERLPDVEPRMKGNQVSSVVAPPDHKLPEKQNLAIGDTTKLGHLKITPIKVTQGELQYEPLGGGKGLSASSHRSLKLWLRIENVSTDQEIAPLRSLAFKQQANGFVCAASQKTAKGHKVWPAKLDKQPYRVRQHNIDKTLKPGESYETFIPTSADGIDKMLDAGGPLVWRVWLRKGYSPKNYGVTTLIDVTFDDSDIKSDA